MINKIAIMPLNPRLIKDAFHQIYYLEKSKFMTDMLSKLNGGGLPCAER
jgi:hypothetical protein